MFKSDFQQQYWLTKKIVQRKLGSKEDECIQDSDAPLDSKICLFSSISSGCFTLDKITEKLIEKLNAISGNQNAIGKFLIDIISQTCSSKSIDKHTIAIGKALSYESQQLNTLRPILSRFEHELSIFNNHAVSDVSLTVLRMEKERTEYRAALSWMKSVSVNMDPESCKDVRKYRKTQELVKKSKTKFEHDENTCFQKIDLLAAARCNMLSHTLAPYQTVLLNLMKNIVEVYASTLAYLKQCEDDSNFYSLKENICTDEDQNRLLFFEDAFKDDNKNNVESNQKKHKEENKEDPTVVENANDNVEQLLLFDLKNDDELEKQLDIEKQSNEFFKSNFNNEKSSAERNISNDNVQSWFDIFAELDPLSKNIRNEKFLQNSELT